MAGVSKKEKWKDICPTESHSLNCCGRMGGCLLAAPYERYRRKQG
jgi:hypothetical protein